VDFVDLPRRVRMRVAHVLNRDLEEITPESRCMHREDGTGFAQEDRKDRLAENAESPDLSKSEE